MDVLMSATILLAIPLLLFSSNVRQWKQLAGKTLASLFLGLIAVVVVIVLGYLIFYTKGSKDLWKVAGMLVGVYTGGTPNLAALKMMLNVDADTYILTHTYDLVVGIFYLAFLMTFGQKSFVGFCQNSLLHWIRWMLKILMVKIHSGESLKEISFSLAQGVWRNLSHLCHC